MRHYILILFIVVLYTQGVGTTMGIPEEVYKMILIILPLLFLILKNRNTRVPPGLWIIVLYTSWAVFSSVYNEQGIVQGLLFSRYLIMGYLIFYAVYNSYFGYKTLKLIHGIIFSLFFLQVGASIVEIVFFGPTEAIVGTMANASGGLATTFPMFAFCFFFSAYLFEKRRKYLMLLVGISFFIVGFASGKLGIYFLIPILVILGYFMFLHLEKLPILNRQTLSIVAGFGVMALLIVIVIPMADERTERLDMAELSLFERIEMFVSFAEEGEGMVVEDYTISRTSTSERVIEETFKRPPEIFLFGFGFSAYQAVGQTLGQGAFEEYKIVYGITGWTYDALVMGWPGILLHVMFFWVVFRKSFLIYKKYKLNSFGKTIVFACLLNFITFLSNYFFYNYNFTVGGWVICIHMYFSALILAPQYKTLLTKNVVKCPKKIAMI